MAGRPSLAGGRDETAMPGLFTAAFAVILLAVFILFGIRSGSPRLKRWVARFARSAAANSVPTLYTGLMAFFLALFDRQILAEFAPFSIGHKTFIRCCYPLPFLSIARLYFSDPGRITKHNWGTRKWASTSLFPYDNILYRANNECRTCMFIKPARSKHCSACNCCVAMQDHHCVWVNNCVGILNFRWFLAFLLVNLYVFVYGTVLLTWALYPSIVTAWRDPTRVWLRALIAQGNTQRTGACLLMLAVSLMPLVIVFLGFHARYVWAGVTTNEADKWEEVAWNIPDRTLYLYPGTSILLLKYADGTYNRRLTAAEATAVQGQTPQLVTNIRELPNIYDHGFLANLKTVLCTSK